MFPWEWIRRIGYNRHKKLFESLLLYGIPDESNDSLVRDLRSELKDQWEISDTEHGDDDLYPWRHVAGNDSENEESEEEEKVDWSLKVKQRRFLQRLV